VEVATSDNNQPSPPVGAVATAAITQPEASPENDTFAAELTAVPLAEEEQTATPPRTGGEAAAAGSAVAADVTPTALPPTSLPQVTVIGALAAVPEEAPASSPPEAGQNSTTAAWLPYGVFGLIMFALLTLLLWRRGRTAD
jgi:hypothetical protein